VGGEHQPPSYEQPQFARPRDAVLYGMSLEAWACESAGRADSLFGWVAWISNSHAELADITDAFEETIAASGLVDTADLVGNFLLLQDGQSKEVQIVEFASEDEARKAYRRVEAILEDLEGGDG
jgi:hypothetical protein